jgi:CubicO group peptidase (beta-lactamase class C family)
MSEVVEGLSLARLSRIRDVVEGHLAEQKYFGAEILVARNGVVAFHETMGYRDRANNVPLEQSAVYSVFSMSKTFTSVLALKWVEQGLLALTTKVSEIIPEFSGGHRGNVTLYHLLTHTAGFPTVFNPIPRMYIDQLDEMIAAICRVIQCEAEPGTQGSYSPAVNHALMGEMVRRTDPLGRSFRDIMTQEVIQPLGMKDTSVGLRKDLRDRHIMPTWLYDKGELCHHGHSDLGTDGAFLEEHAEMPWVGIATTVSDLFRITEMLRREGELDGTRLLSPITVRQMHKNRTGEMLNQLHGKNAIKRGWGPIPLYSGLGVFLRGTAMCHHQFGTFSSPETFGQHGQGSMLYWVDPVNQVTFIHMSHGVIVEGENFARMQKLSDIAITSIVE